MDYPIIDADTHINEPPDLWETHLPAALRERAPHVIDGTFGGKAWALENGRTFAVNRLVNTAGISPTDWELIPKDGFDSMRSGAWDPVARLADMDIDMVDMHMLFPTYALLVCGSEDAAFHNECIRAYNNWISDFCGHAPHRLVAQAMLPTSGVDDAIAEANRVRELPGIKGVVLNTWPNGSKVAKHADDDRFWSALEDLDLPACAHVGFNVGGEALDHMDDPEMLLSMATLPFINQEKLAIDAMPVASELILGGVLDRHPRLRFAFVEVGIGWVPFFLEQSDDNFMRHRFWTHTNLSMLPSEYWARQCAATFQVDRYGVGNRHAVGIDTVMWSSDYPHAGADWPLARERINMQFRDVPADERRMLTSDNARRFFALDDVLATKV